MIAVNVLHPTDISQLPDSDIQVLKRYFTGARSCLDVSFTYEAWVAGHYLTFAAREPNPSPSSFMQFMHETYADVAQIPLPAAIMH